MKRLASSFLFMLVVYMVAGGAKAYVAGDVNADSLVDIDDAVYELNYLFRNGYPPVCFECGDPNADCKIDISDALYLLNFLFRQGADPQIVECGWSEPVNMGAPINTSASDYTTSFSLDRKRMVLSSSRDGTYGNKDIWYSFRDDTTQPWPDPINCGPNVNSQLEDRHPCISPDGNKIYFIAWCRPGGYGGWDVWISTWDSTEGQWGVPQNAGPQLNTESSDWSPFISPDNSKLYLQSGYNPGGLHVSEWTDTEWGVPVWLGENLHENWTEEEPAITADGSTLYFVRWVEGGIPAIFVSYWSGTEWGVAVKLPVHINHPEAGAWDPFISPDGYTLYFTAGSVRPGGMGLGDVWVSERIPVEEGKHYINREGVDTEKQNRPSPLPQAPEPEQSPNKAERR